MADLIETAAAVDGNGDFIEGIYQLEQEDLVLGGAEGIDNLQAKQLLARTNYLKAALLGLNVTAFIRTLLDDADAATARATLGAASPADINAAIAALVASSPAALDTLNELATALGNDANFATTMTNALALKAPLASAALTGNPTAPTPGRFDNDTSIATTAFVQANGLRFNFSAVTGNRNVALTDIGNICWFSGGYAVTMLTPTSLGIPVGASVTFYNTSAANATVTAGAGVSFDALVSPVTIRSGEFVIFVATSSIQWAQFGTADLHKTGSFTSALGASGYQKLPSGLIIQWGAAASSASASTTITFPIAFPSACRSVSATWNGVNPGSSFAYSSATSLTASNFALDAFVNSTSRVSINCGWIAIGH